MDENGNPIPVDTRHGYYSDDIANTFGVPMEQHLKETEVSEQDGFVNIAMFTGVRDEEADTKGVVRPDDPADPSNQDGPDISGNGGDYSG